MDTTYSESVCSRATVYADFKRGWRSIEAEKRAGRLLITGTQKKVQGVEKLISEKRRITFRASAKTGLQTIIHDYLSLRKRCTRWTPHKLTDEQKDFHVDWCRFMI
ncbi:hypothetical protein EVAR_95834_1 [Eumeta japonica]|uniref:Uncharacterized protein n=1 Tax=Eumeta variegata TaxID=151549 RepID=A0A4C1VL84_EUMVA|nr:hypothetical protein EVAR_95834_1 [Eumeta japonica]